MNREPPIYLPAPPRPSIWPWIMDGLAAVGAVALVIGMIIVAVEVAVAFQDIKVMF